MLKLIKIVILRGFVQYLILVLEKKILFSAKLPISANVKNNVLQYNRVITNVGGAYNPTDCAFTAPVDGHYVFSWSTSQYDRKYPYSAITKNGAVLLTESAFANDVNSAADSTSQTVTLHLVTGDRVWIKRTAGSDPHVESSAFDCVLSGFKL